MNRLIELVDVEGLFNRFVAYSPNLVAAFLILFAFWLVYRISRRTLWAVLERARFQETLIRLLVDNTYKLILFSFAVVMAADQLGFNVRAALAGIGVAGIAIGFAAQDSLANVIAGVMILWDKPFVVNDWVTVSDRYGQVTDLTLRSTRIRTPANTYVVIPNKQIADQVLVNHTKQGEVRIEVPVGIAYKEDIPAARAVLLQALKAIEGVAESPAPDIVVESLGASGVDLKVRAWVDNVSQERPTFYRVMEASKLALDAAGIQIPYHHIQLFVENIEDRVWNKLGALSTRSSAGGSHEGTEIS